MNIIPATMIEVVNYLKEQNLVLTKTATDHRVDSATSESQVVSQIQNANTWTVYSPNLSGMTNRAWYDVKIDGYYCDIKISTTKSADNTNAKMHVYYLLTGQDPAENRVPPQDKKIFKLMKENENIDEERDFYYLVVNKDDLDDIFVVSLKSIAKLNPAANNMPFQAKWDDCRVPVHRTWSEARHFLLGKWAESIKRKLNTLSEGMPIAYPEFFK